MWGLIFTAIILNVLLFGRIVGYRKSNATTEHDKIISKIADRIRTGQSSAILGLISEEKSEILRHLNNNDQNLYGEEASKLIFSYIDIGLDLDKNSKPDDFWRKALETATKHGDDSIKNAYKKCEQDGYTQKSIDDFLDLLSQSEKMLVLLLDRFEKFLDYEHFENNFEFFSTLRKLAGSKIHGPLSLVITTNLSLPRMVEEIQSNKEISQVLNFIEAMPIFKSSDDEINKILADVGNTELKQYLKDMIGWSSYLTKTIVTHLEHADLMGKFDKEKTQSFICRHLRRSLESMLKSWPKDVWDVFLLVYNGENIAVIEQRKYANALLELEVQGILEESNKKWQLRTKIFETCFRDAEELREFMPKLEGDDSCH